MPNHVTSLISAPKEVLDFMGEEFDFNNILPMPECLNITEGTTTAIGMALETDNYTDGWCNSKEEALKKIEGFKESEEEIRELGRQALSNIEKLGHQSWYSWACDKWGTKWNAYEVFRADEESLSIQTAWSCPYPIFEALSEKFPDAEISVQYADEDTGSNVGEFTFQGGELIEEFIPKEQSKQAYELAFDIVGGDEYYRWDEEAKEYVYDDDEEEE
jgi:hypothetical protein